MPTPPKTFKVLKNEKKSHRTKAELAAREKGEQALASGVALRESVRTKSNPAAHKEFVRLKKLLKNIGKNDALNEAIINRYCVLFAECENMEAIRDRFADTMDRLEEAFADDRIEVEDYLKARTEAQGQLIALDRQLQAKRKMLLSIEKESLMTIQSVMRCIPKKPAEDEEDDEMQALLSRRR